MALWQGNGKGLLGSKLVCRYQSIYRDSIVQAEQRQRNKKFPTLGCICSTIDATGEGTSHSRDSLLRLRDWKNGIFVDKPSVQPMSQWRWGPQELNFVFLGQIRQLWLTEYIKSGCRANPDPGGFKWSIMYKRDGVPWRDWTSSILLARQ